jgi:uncharacterized YccA/Bax inhibitor family protein
MTPEQVEAEYSVVLAAFKVAARVIAIRLFLFLSLIGSFTLAIIATNNQNPQSAWVLLLYACVTTLPLSVLEFKGRKGG